MVAAHAVLCMLCTAPAAVAATLAAAVCCQAALLVTLSCGLHAVPSQQARCRKSRLLGMQVHTCPQSLPSLGHATLGVMI